MQSFWKIKTVFLVGALTLFLFHCQNRTSPTEPAPPVDAARQVIILYTNDEHGWMEETTTSPGAAALMYQWKQEENYTPDGPFLILSGGDMWTGPAISTWYQGKPMVEVMNAMHYRAAAIGNHEFDFKVEVLRQRLAEAEFPFLSANIRRKNDGQIPDFATPYVVEKVNDIRVGLIGLTTTSAPLSTFPDNVADYDFLDYSTALQEVVPKVKADSAELLVVVGHIPYEQAVSLVPVARSLGISVIGAGHDHQRDSGIYNGVAVVESGSYLRAYGKVDISFDTAADTVISMSVATYDNKGGPRDAGVAVIVGRWQSLLRDTLGQVIGYVQKEIPRNSNEMYNLVTDSWLHTFPEADVSLTNRGGIRQSIPAGEITLATIVGVLPFENNILKLQLTGQELINCLVKDIIVGGMTTIGGYKLASGEPIYPDSTYLVLTTDYLYARSDYPFSRYDPAPVNTAVNYRQPLIDWLQALGTSPSNPLDQYLDSQPRQ